MSSALVGEVSLSLAVSPTATGDVSLHQQASSDQHSDSESDGVSPSYDASLLAELDERAADDEERIAMGEGYVWGESSWRTGEEVSSTEFLALSPTQTTLAADLTIRDITDQPYRVLEDDEHGKLDVSDVCVVKRYELAHPLWIQAGRAAFTAQQAAAVAASSTTQTVHANEINDSSAGARPVEPSPRTSRGKGGSGPASRSASRTGHRDDQESGGLTSPAAKPAVKKGLTGSAAAAALAAAASASAAEAAAAAAAQTLSLVRDRTLSLCQAVYRARWRHLQSRLQIQRRIPDSPTGRVPELSPNDDLWNVQLERFTVSADSSASVCILSQGLHTIAVRHSGWSQPGSVGDSHATISYEFDGCRYRQRLLVRSFSSGPISYSDDAHRFDEKVWNGAKSWIDSTLLCPLQLPSDRSGWIRLWDEVLPFESCSTHLQPLRNAYIGGIGEQQQTTSVTEKQDDGEQQDSQTEGGGEPHEPNIGERGA